MEDRLLESLAGCGGVSQWIRADVQALAGLRPGNNCEKGLSLHTCVPNRQLNDLGLLLTGACCQPKPNLESSPQESHDHVANR